MDSAGRDDSDSMGKTGDKGKGKGKDTGKDKPKAKAKAHGKEGKGKEAKGKNKGANQGKAGQWRAQQGQEIPLGGISPSPAVVSARPAKP